MNEEVDARDSVEQLRLQQQRTRRASRLPWWVFVLMFALIAGTTAANDFVTLSVGKVIALIVLVALVATLVLAFVTGSAPLSHVRGVQPRQVFNPRVFGFVVAAAGLGGWLISQYGQTLTGPLAAGIGMSSYPNTVIGIIYGAAITLLFAMSQGLSGAAARRASQ